MVFFRNAAIHALPTVVCLFQLKKLHLYNEKDPILVLDASCRAETFLGNQIRITEALYLTCAFQIVLFLSMTMCNQPLYRNFI